MITIVEESQDSSGCHEPESSSVSGCDDVGEVTEFERTQKRDGRDQYLYQWKAPKKRRGLSKSTEFRGDFDIGVYKGLCILQGSKRETSKH